MTDLINESAGAIVMGWRVDEDHVETLAGTGMCFAFTGLFFTLGILVDVMFFLPLTIVPLTLPAVLFVPFLLATPIYIVPDKYEDAPLGDLIRAEMRDYEDDMGAHREALRDWQHRLARSQMTDRQRKIDDLSQSLAQLDKKHRDQRKALRHVKSQFAHTLMKRADLVPEWGPGSKPKRERVTSDD
jgi:hypothetical protein